MSEYGLFICTKGKDDKYSVQCEGFDEKLMLLSEKAREAYLRHIEAAHCNGMDIEVWYYIEREKEKED